PADGDGEAPSRAAERGSRDERAARRAVGLQALGEVDGVADIGVLAAVAGADVGADRASRVDADAHVEGVAGRAPGGDELEQALGGAQRAVRAAEGREDAVADVLVHVAAALVDGLRRGAE